MDLKKYETLGWFEQEVATSYGNFIYLTNEQKDLIFVSVGRIDGLQTNSVEDIEASIEAYELYYTDKECVEEIKTMSISDVTGSDKVTEELFRIVKRKDSKIS